VYRAFNRKTRQEVAVKCIDKKALTPEDLAALKIEVKAMELLSDNPFFIKYFDFFEEPTMFYLVIELISGGELFDRICEKEKYTEREARAVIIHLTKAVYYMHQKNIVHRDLKPENILLKSKTDDTSIKLADLGFAALLSPTKSLMTTPCGTPGYVAPEILSGKPYSSPVDIWSLGVIFYILLCGYPPFVSERDDQKELFELIKHGKYTFDPTDWGKISPGAKDLVSKILVVDPAKRFTAQQILDHPWMKLDAALLPELVLTSQQEKLRRFNARRRLKKAMKAVRSTVRMRLLMAARTGQLKRIADTMPVEAASQNPPPPPPKSMQQPLTPSSSSNSVSTTNPSRIVSGSTMHARVSNVMTGVTTHSS
jgi:calcium/calmodulin-dependent protein kinase I